MSVLITRQLLHDYQWVGFDDGHIIVHYKNLKPEKPLFDVAITDAASIRKVGANAARLVKGVPFKK